MYLLSPRIKFSCSLFLSIEYEEVFNTDYNIFGIDNEIKKDYSTKNNNLIREMLSIKDIDNKLSNYV